MKIGLEAAMRRSDKEITEFAEKLKVLDRCDVIRLGMVRDVRQMFLLRIQMYSSRLIITLML